MTTNQLKWAELTEGRRHNLVTERQTDTSLSEGRRHNMASESINAYLADSSAKQAAASTIQAAASQLQAEVASRKQDIADQQWDATKLMYPSAYSNQIDKDKAQTDYFKASAYNQRGLGDMHGRQADWAWFDAAAGVVGKVLPAASMLPLY